MRLLLIMVGVGLLGYPFYVQEPNKPKFSPKAYATYVVLPSFNLFRHFDS